MKTLPTIGIAAVLILITGCTTIREQATAGTAPMPGTTVVLTVYGMSCPLCSNNLDGQFKKIDGVESVNIDLDTGAVTIGLAETHAVTQAQLASAVKAAGFTLANIDTK